MLLSTKAANVFFFFPPLSSVHSEFNEKDRPLSPRSCFPSQPPENEGKWGILFFFFFPGKKIPFPAAGGRKKIITARGHGQVILSSSFVQDKHPPPHPPPAAAFFKMSPLQLFPFSCSPPSGPPQLTCAAQPTRSSRR